MVKPCVWLKEEPSQFPMGQTAQSLTCSIMEKPHTRLDKCPRILIARFRARNSVRVSAPLFFPRCGMHQQARLSGGVVWTFNNDGAVCSAKASERGAASLPREMQPMSKSSEESVKTKVSSRRERERFALVSLVSSCTH